MQYFDIIFARCHLVDMVYNYILALSEYLTATQGCDLILYNLFKSSNYFYVILMTNASTVDSPIRAVMTPKNSRIMEM